MILLETRCLSAFYGDFQALYGIDLKLEEGETIAIIGANGAGKSTFLKTVVGLLAAEHESVILAGRPIGGLPAAEIVRAGISLVPEGRRLFPSLTVEENLLMGGYLMGRPSQARAAAHRVLDRYPRLAERRSQRAGVLSGGERRLLEISRALIMDPDVLLVDEPSIGLEPRFIDMVFEILGDLQRKEGKTIVMVEQNAKKGLEFADLGYVLAAGQLALAGRGEELLADPNVGRLFLGG
jgi:branched-chain amino acid transport system ATP-binding protein